MKLVLQGIGKLMGLFTRKGKNIGKPVEYTVGYTANYSIYVHERNLNYRVGQWKFLEEPTRKKKEEYFGVAKKIIASGGTLDQAMAAAALRLQREAQKITPVDTGNLRASAVTRKVK